MDGMTMSSAEPLRRAQRRRRDMPGDPRSRGLDVGKGDGTFHALRPFGMRRMVGPVAIGRVLPHGRSEFQDKPDARGLD